MKMMGAAQIGIRCRADDNEAKKRITPHVVRTARRYGGQMLGDIDIDTGEAVYRAEIDEGRYVITALAVQRRQRRAGGY